MFVFCVVKYKVFGFFLVVCGEVKYIYIYKKEKMMFMKVFEGSYKVELICVDLECFCKYRLFKSLEEYKK